MIVSALILRGGSGNDIYAKLSVPTILQIQQTLVDSSFVPASFLSSHSVGIYTPYN
jgi:hypothetical protein